MSHKTSFLFEKKTSLTRIWQRHDGKLDIIDVTFVSSSEMKDNCEMWHPEILKQGGAHLRQTKVFERCGLFH